MRVLIAGSGGREHALAWKVSQSSSLTALYCAPGNPGTESLGVNVDLKDNQAITAFCLNEKIDLVIAGPEQPLVDGLADDLAEAGIACFGPKAAGARLEGSKAFAKEVMEATGVPTGKYRRFTEFDEACRYAASQSFPLVVKADGLAAGKGVTICANIDEANQALREAMIDNKFGEAGSQVVIEEFLSGTEMSFHVISDGERLLPLVTAKDHKALLEGGKGPNTGGMGTCAPNPDITDALADQVLTTICKPVIDYMRAEGNPFRGVLFVGLMLTESGPKVLEFNVRFGDPETQVMMPLLDFDLLPVLYGAATGKLPADPTPMSNKAAVCVVLASAGYPGSYNKGMYIAGLSNGSDYQIFQAGTKRTEDGRVVTNGGRVLGVTAWADELESARTRAYELVGNVCFEGITFRQDIGGSVE